MRRAGTLLTGLVLAAPLALAMPQFRTAVITQLHYDEGNPLWQYDRRVMACTYCHVKESGGRPWNPFGQALQAQFVKDAQAGRPQKFPQVLHTLLSAQGDADGDGYTDVLEVYARTLPGDPASAPTVPVRELQAAFEKAGGVARYAPKTKK